MTAFITLGNAARLLGAQGDGTGDADFWLSLLESQADELKAVKCWGDRTNSALPGGVSYWRSPEQWQIPRIVFLAWCDKYGCQLRLDEQKTPTSHDTTAKGIDESRRSKQIARILDAIRHLQWDAMSIPTGGKGEIKTRCLSDAQLFTDAGFARAWQAAINAGLLRVENHDTYARR